MDFMGRVAKGIEPTDCWLWLGSLHRQGYGVVRVQSRPSKYVLAHRMSYELHHGVIPNGLFVLHECDCPPCVNPSHLKLGTQLDNMRQAFERGRVGRARGEDHHGAKITDADTLEIMALLEAGVRQTEIAWRFGISKSLVTAIKRGRCRRHLTAVPDQKARG